MSNVLLATSNTPTNGILNGGNSGSGGGGHIIINTQTSPLIHQTSSSSSSSPVLNNTQNTNAHHIQIATLNQTILPYHSTSYKDTRWLTLEVCREHQRNKCNRNETECKFAHPPAHVEIINGKVIACYDSLKGKCTRKEPPCKYLHPPQHLKDQLLQNGKINLVLKQVALAMMQQQQQQQVQHQQVHQHQQVQQHQTHHLTNAQTLLTTQQPTPYAYQNAHGPIFNQLPAALQNATIGYPQVQMTNANGQPTLVPVQITNGYHTSTGLQMPQTAIYATDLIQHAVAAQNTPNGLLPHQRTDRLTQYSPQLNTAFISNQNNDESAINGVTYALDNNNQPFQIQPYQLISNGMQTIQYRPTQVATSTNLTATQQSNSNNNSNNSANNVNSNSNNNLNSNSSNTTTNSTNNDENGNATDLNKQGNIYPTQLVKRAALADSKTGLPVFPYQHHQQLHHPHHPHHLQQQQQFTNLTPQQAAALFQGGIAMQYAQYPTAYSIQYNGHPTGLPRL